MTSEQETALWEEIYHLRALIGRLEGKLCYSSRGEQIAHMQILVHEVLPLPPGPQRAGALGAFSRHRAGCEEVNQLLRDAGQ